VTRPDPAERLLSKVEVADSGCWEWTAAKDPTGYGRFSVARSMDYAHRAAYKLLVGPIPAGLDLDHLCRNRGCVNPDHLEPVTRRENLLRSEETLTKAHHDGRDCGFDGCKNCRRFRVAS
jgi:hypothetical protein